MTVSEGDKACAMGLGADALDAEFVIDTPENDAKLILARVWNRLDQVEKELIKTKELLAEAGKVIDEIAPVRAQVSYTRAHR